MALARLKFLDKSEKEVTHEQTIECLETIGMKVSSNQILRLLDDSGAKVDFKTQIAKIPEEMVKEALKNAPKEMTLHARDRKWDMRIPVDS